ncbi:uncharacterized protein LOC34620851 [Cyclospora cayetanensis]|uniref:Uncharacterized protein LOC34620851 n=1 Tax=Cyclospora cayetanensis TaxID=88456 RepID=A0A6P6RTJ5_9EIME|nr:uncharacterized protein LOC34620851 [Cyclospora cayetanensis]
MRKVTFDAWRSSSKRKCDFLSLCILAGVCLATETFSLISAIRCPLLLCTNLALLAIRQVLSSNILLPEDAIVQEASGQLLFENTEISGKVPQGTAILKVKGNDPLETLGLFVVDYSKPEFLDRVYTESGSQVFCDFRPFRQCFTRNGDGGPEFLEHGATLTSDSGEKLRYLRYPSGGSILTRPKVDGVGMHSTEPKSSALTAQAGPAPSTYIIDQFSNEIDGRNLMLPYLFASECTDFGPVEFPSQFDEASYSFIGQTSGDLQFCEVNPPMVTGKQMVALASGKRAPRIYCDTATQALLYFEPHMPSHDAKFRQSQRMTNKLTGQPASCDQLASEANNIFSVSRYEPERGRTKGEKIYSYTNILGRRAFMPLEIQLFAESELGEPCSVQQFQLLQQPNYNLHSEIGHNTTIACKKLRQYPLRDIKRDALMIQLSGSDLWMELPAGTVLALPRDDLPPGILSLHSYQPAFSSSGVFKAPELRRHIISLKAAWPFTWGPPMFQAVELCLCVDATDKGSPIDPAVIFIADGSEEDTGFLYQTAEGKKVFVGQLRDGTFVGNLGISFVAKNAANENASFEYGVAQLQRGSSLVLSSVPEALVLQRDIIKYNVVFYGGPSIVCAWQEENAYWFLVRRGHFSAKINASIKDLATSMMNRYKPSGAPTILPRFPSTALCNLCALNNLQSPPIGQLDVPIGELQHKPLNKESLPFSVVVRLPVNMLHSTTSHGLIQQLHIALSILLEDVVSLPRPLANRITFYGTALHTLHKILESGHCDRCPENNSCSFCRAVTFRDFVYVDIQGLGISPETMPDSFSWAEFRGQEFLLFVNTNSGPALLGAEFDFHTQMLTSHPSRKHLPQLKDYATVCLNAHISSMALKKRNEESFCPRLANQLKSLLKGLSRKDFVSLMNSAEFRDAIIEGCKIQVEDAVTSCMEGDGELLGLQRLPEFRVNGRSAMYEYLRSLLFPGTSNLVPKTLLGSIGEELQRASFEDKEALLSAVPSLKTFITDRMAGITTALTLSSLTVSVAVESSPHNSCPIVDHLFREEGKEKALTILSGIDSAVAAKGIKPSKGSAFYVGLWSSPLRGLLILENILSGKAAVPPEDAHSDSTSPEATGKLDSDRDAKIKMKTKAYARRLREQQAQKYADIQAALSWPAEKEPDTIEECRMFVQAAHRFVLVPGEINNLFYPRSDTVSSDINRTMPVRHVAEEAGPFMRRIISTTPNTYQQVCKRLGWTSIRLPQNAEEAQAFAEALREVRALQGPVKKWILALQNQVPDSMTWGEIRTIIDPAHGPHTKVPFFLPSSGKCQCVRSAGRNRCYIDALKSIEDLIFRLSLLLPAALAKYVTKDTKELSTDAAALCAATGVFASAWQQQQVEAGFAHANSRLAHSMLVERLKKAGDYSLTEINEHGLENTAEYTKRKKMLNNRFSSGAMRKCLKLVNVGGSVAHTPAGGSGAKMAARSLYGGIVNTVGVSAVQVDHFMQTLTALGSNAARSSHRTHPLLGLLAALRITQRFKDCFDEAKDITFRSWYLMHLEGDAIIGRLNSREFDAQFASRTYKFAEHASSQAFDKAFKTLMATVTTQWEDAGAFKLLVDGVSGTGGIQIPETAPEDFDTPVDTPLQTVLEYSPSLGNQLISIPPGH